MALAKARSLARPLRPTASRSSSFKARARLPRSPMSAPASLKLTASTAPVDRDRGAGGCWPARVAATRRSLSSAASRAATYRAGPRGGRRARSCPSRRRSRAPGPGAATRCASPAGHAAARARSPARDAGAGRSTEEVLPGVTVLARKRPHRPHAFLVDRRLIADRDHHVKGPWPWRRRPGTRRCRPRCIQATARRRARSRRPDRTRPPSSRRAGRRGRVSVCDQRERVRDVPRTERVLPRPPDPPKGRAPTSTPSSATPLPADAAAPR